MTTAAAENREYAGHSDAVDLLVSSGTYITVVNREIDDEQADALGYVFDVDEAVEQGKTFAVRRVTISGELAQAFGDDNPDWPKVGGAASDDDVVDDSSHPARQTYETFDGEQLSAGELNERVRQAQEADDAAERAADEAERKRLAEQGEALRIAAEREHGALSAKIAELDAALTSAQALADDEGASATDRKQASEDAQKIRHELNELGEQRQRLEGDA